MGISVTGCVGLNASRCQFDQLLGVWKVNNRGLSRVENVDGLIWMCLTPAQEDVLKLGLNFAPAPSKVPFTDTMSLLF